MRVLHLLRFLWDLHVRIAVGTWHVVISGWGRAHHAHPCIIEFPMRCRSDLEIALFASAVTIPPGTIVVGIAAGRGDTKPSMFVHSAYGNDRTVITADLRAQERLLLLAMRGREP